MAVPPTAHRCRDVCDGRIVARCCESRSLLLFLPSVAEIDNALVFLRAAETSREDWPISLLFLDRWSGSHLPVVLLLLFLTAPNYHVRLHDKVSTVAEKSRAVAQSVAQPE